MSLIDIRAYVETSIDKIQFSDGNGSKIPYRTDIAKFLTKSILHERFIFIEAEDISEFLAIRKDNVEDLIDALQKAVQLGWNK